LPKTSKAMTKVIGVKMSFTIKKDSLFKRLSSKRKKDPKTRIKKMLNAKTVLMRGFDTIINLQHQIPIQF